jgi:hypothetical protein
MLQAHLLPSLWVLAIGGRCLFYWLFICTGVCTGGIALMMHVMLHAHVRQNVYTPVAFSSICHKPVTFVKRAADTTDYSRIIN